jgi:cell division protein FtsL
MATKQRVIRLKGEKFLVWSIVILVILNFVGPAFSMAMLSKTNYEVERVKNKIKKQESLNESLSMKINELSSLNNIENVAALYGLEFNDNNIKIITSQE